MTPKGSYQFHAQACSEDIYHLHVTGDGWATYDSEVKLSLPDVSAELAGAKSRMTFAQDGTLAVVGHDGATYLSSSTGRCFGQSGAASMFEFAREEGDQFYGLGEKWTGFEHSGKNTKFWNTDVVADFHSESYIHGRPPADPVYVSVPYLILKRKNTFVGLLLDNPHATFISTGQRSISIASQMSLKLGRGAIHLGAEQGRPSLFILIGPSLAELTRKLQRLVGVTPLPPAWALGYHQCRWGYQSEADLKWLDRSFRQHRIPADGLWLDIDYMDHYKVFTLNRRHFPKPESALKKLNDAGRKIVPILDPGVAREPGYSVYERGRKEKAFCLNSQRDDYIGLVWPGLTVFPDFSLPAARDWWAREVAEFARLGFYGAWLDMNDPATGPVDNQDMLFQHGARDHSFYHNQYALGMAIASRKGFLEAHPYDRPFLLSRSGCTGSNRFTALWTGDNFSNYHHLKNSIPTTLNLALSGIPFNGADVGGFGSDTTPELMLDWMKAAFLFPFFRNHTSRDTRHQEPWAFGAKVLAVLRRYIQLRYRLRPYLYQLFVEQERSGEAILRPLFYDFADTARLPLGLVDDQFMIGPCLMQAPFVEEKQVARDVVLPKGYWYAPLERKWTAGGRKIRVRANATDTPLYVRDGSILPLARTAEADNAFDGRRADFHIFLGKAMSASIRYVFDDGATFAYQEGKRSEIEITAQRRGTILDVTIKSPADGFGAGDFTFTVSTAITNLRVNKADAKVCASQGVPFDLGKVKTWMV